MYGLKYTLKYKMQTKLCDFDLFRKLWLPSWCNNIVGCDCQW